MEKSEVQRKVQLATSEEVFRKTGGIFVPVASSARHVHLCHADVERLFGPGHQLTVSACCPSRGSTPARSR